jgi:hypothetical protein
MNLKSTFSSRAVDLVLVGEDGRLMVWKNPKSAPSRLPKPKYLDFPTALTWGLNVAGQTGFPGKGIIPKPREVDITAVDGKISGMIAGDHFSVLITDSGEFYLCGFFIHRKGDFGKIGKEKKFGSYFSLCFCDVKMNN